MSSRHVWMTPGDINSAWMTALGLDPTLVSAYQYAIIDHTANTITVWQMGRDDDGKIVITNDGLPRQNQVTVPLRAEPPT